MSSEKMYSEKMYNEKMYGEKMYGEKMYRGKMYGEQMYGEQIHNEKMSTTQDAEFKRKERKATATRCWKEWDDAHQAVKKQKQGIASLEQSLREISYNGYTKGMRKNELETVIRKAKERLAGFEERAEECSARLKSADPNREYVTSLLDKTRIYDPLRDREAALESGEWKMSWQDMDFISNYLS